MADFTQKSVTKSAERKFTTPIDAMANFVTLVNKFISTNPFGCVSYTSGGQTIAGVVKGTEYYSGKISVLFCNLQDKPPYFFCIV